MREHERERKGQKESELKGEYDTYTVGQISGPVC